jgi:ankyrin repeat protein
MKIPFFNKKKNIEPTFEQLTEILRTGDFKELEKRKNKGIDFCITDSYDGKNALEYSIHNKIYTGIDNLKMIKFLIDCGIDLNHKTNKRAHEYSALHYSVLNKDLESIKNLLTLKAEIEIQDKYGNTPLIRAVMDYKGETELLAIIEFLIDKGASLKKKNFHDISAKDHINNIGGGIDAGYNNAVWDLRPLAKKH